ncbi:septal ring lytic transglycosylase RlpA family protein [Treponema vincentii]|uniref:Probable endolytic peptidoglycan transglycosylase RlpA n=1 Tax=Treponema vincentii TaxID=69710 RepID=A0A6P1Y4D1_9SPIR|nr:septal ring lytic transglycosylase RlpA family protein [Treponema vincentii]QHX44140.1 septal ring lytic transglycosylase RlpA family protein [Treponema vincentii]
MRKYHVLSALVGALLLLPLGAEELLTAETYASYYGEAFNGRPTSSGEIFDMNAYTAAHKTLPFGTFLEVTNLENGKKVVVRVNDRGPFVPNREIDLSKAAAKSLGMISRGITRVSIKRVDSLDHAALVATTDVYSDTTTESAPKGAHPVTDSQPEAVPVQKEAVSDIPAKGSDTAAETAPSKVTQAQASQPNTTQRQPSSVDQQTAKPDTVKGVANRSASAQPAQTPAPVYSQGTSGVLWRIQLGAFAREENALRLVVQLRKAGFDPAYERTEKSVRVVLPGIQPDDLEKVKEALANHSFTDYVIRQESW